MTLTVAVTGPTGEIGLRVLDAMQRHPQIGRVIGMARRPFDPHERGWTKVDYQRGDIMDRTAVDAVVADADVVVHLAYLIMGSREQTRRVNLAGTRNVFEATVAAPRARRLVYTSSVAAYGYHPDNPVPLTEDVPVRGTREHYYSAQKAACEALLHEVVNDDLDVYVLRPCVVAGPHATALADSMPWRKVQTLLPAPLRAAAGVLPTLLPLMPDPGLPLQLVHHDDVADAVVLAALGAGRPGAYNIAGDGTVSLTDVAHATGARAVRVPAAVASAASKVLARAPLVPSVAEWIHVTRASVVMDTARAKEILGWRPRYTSRQTLDELAAAL